MIKYKSYKWGGFVEKETMNIKIPVILLKGMLGACVLTFGAALILALLLWKTGISESSIHIAVDIVYVLSCFLSGLYCGKKIKTRRFLWGLIVGGLYFSILLILGIVIKDNHTAVSLTSKALICLGSGMLGGMIS